jgi:hypothetical protein
MAAQIMDRTVIETSSEADPTPLESSNATDNADELRRRLVLIDVRRLRREAGRPPTTGAGDWRVGTRLAMSMVALLLALLAFVVFGPYDPLQALLDALAVLGVVAGSLLLFAPLLGGRRSSIAQ